jgi:hypothetical protein
MSAHRHHADVYKLFYQVVLGFLVDFYVGRVRTFLEVILELIVLRCPEGE